MSRMINEFEEGTILTGSRVTRRHHEQMHSIQQKCAKEIKSMVDVLEDMGNPFEEDSGDLLTRDNQEIMSDAVIQAVSDVVCLGQEQYDSFVNERLVEASVPITEPIHRNALPRFSRPGTKTISKQKAQLTTLKEDCALFSRLYIACQSRDGDLNEFFKHENQPWPPSLSKAGKMRDGTKASLLTCLEGMSYAPNGTPQVDAKIMDGSVVVHMLPSGTSTTFQDYASNVFMPYIEGQLQSVRRIDIVWDVYRDDSLKSATRDARGTGTRRKVIPSARIPGNWKSFLRVNENKTQLFHLLAKHTVEDHLQIDGKQLCSTYDEQVLSSPQRNDTNDIEPSNHEEADTRIILHVLDAALTGHHDKNL